MSAHSVQPFGRLLVTYIYTNVLFYYIDKLFSNCYNYFYFYFYIFTVKAVANDFNTESDLKELEQFISENEENLGTAQMTANQMIEGTRLA